MKIGGRKRLGRALGRVAPADPDMQAVGFSSLSPNGGGVGICCWLFLCYQTASSYKWDSSYWLMGVMYFLKVSINITVLR